MGEVEQHRMKTEGLVKLDLLAFKPNEEIEATLRRDVATAQGNLDRYLDKKADYVIQNSGGDSDPKSTSDPN